MELFFDSDAVVADRFHITEDRQIIIDLENVNAEEKVMRAFDTSEFSGAVVFVSAYRRKSNPENLRITLQLRDNVRSILSKSGKKVTLKIENRYGAFARAKEKGISLHLTLRLLNCSQNVASLSILRASSICQDRNAALLYL